MPLVRIEKSKGLFQESGKGFLSKPLDTQAVVNNFEIDTSLGFNLPVSAADAGQTGVILKDGTENGQLALITNVGTENFDFADGHFAAQPEDATLVAGNSILCVWNSTAWSLTSQSLS
jgi:hypothetical protein